MASRAATTFWFFFAFGGMFVVMGSYRGMKLAGEAGHGYDAAGWPTVPGVVTESTIAEHSTAGPRGGTQTTYSPQVSYSYTVGGDARVGHRVSFGEIITSHVADAQATVARYPVGAMVTVHVFGGESTLEAGPPSGRAWRRALAPAGLGVFFWLIGAVAAWRTRRRFT